MSDPNAAPESTADKLVRKVKETAKAWVGLVLGLLTVASTQTEIPLPDPWSRYISFALAVVTAVAVWATPNQPDQTTVNKVVSQLPVAVAIPVDPAVDNEPNSGHV